MQRASRKKAIPKRRGRPATGHDPVSTIRLSPTLKSKIDSWAKKQADQPSRSGAIRRLLILALNGEGTNKEGASYAQLSSGTKNAITRGDATRRLAGFQIRAARAILGWSAEDLARQSSVGLRTIRRAELSHHHTNITMENEQILRRVLEGAGVEFIDQNGGGPGVRLRRPADAQTGRV